MDQKIGIHFGTTYDGKGSKQLHDGVAQAGSALTRLKDSIKNMGSGIGSALKSVGSNLMNIKAGFDMLMGVASKLGEAIKNAFDMSRMENSFKFLIGSTDEAKRHMQELYELGRTPPFSTKEFASASKTLMLLTNNVLGGKDSLVMLGDAADAVGVPIETMAESVGYFYEMLRDGEPISKASKSLVRMGAISPEVAAQMKQMQEEGKPLNEIWTTLTTSLTKFNGSMDNTANSAGGKVQELVSQWEEAKTKIGISVAEIADKHVGHLIDKMDELVKNDGFKDWAEDSISWIGKVGSALGSVLGAVHGGAVDFGDTIGTMIGGFSEGGFSGMMKVGRDRMNAQEEETIADSNGNSNKVEKIEIVKGSNGLNTPQTQKDLDEAQAKQDEKFNKEQLDAIKKAGEKLSVDQEKIADNNRKAIEEDAKEIEKARKAQEEAEEKERKAQEEAAKKKKKAQEEAEEKERKRRQDEASRLLAQIRNKLDKIHEQQRKEQFYRDISNGGHDGSSGYNDGYRPVDENGRFLRPEHQQEAGRQAGRGERNLDSQRLGPNREAAMRQQYDDLKKEIDKNVGGVEGLSDRDRQKYNKLKKFFDPEEDKLKKAADQIKKSDITALGEKLDDIAEALGLSLIMN